MGKINPCLKRLFIFFNLLFAIVGGVFILLAMLSQGFGDQAQFEGRTSGLITLYVVGGVTMAMALLGAYGAYKEKRIHLIVFLSAMCVGCLGLLRVAIPVAVVRPELNVAIEAKFRELLPLDRNAPDVRRVAEKVQLTFECCGLFSYEDWSGNVPESCSCQEEQQEEEGLCQRVKYGTMLFSFIEPATTTKSIYKKTCFPILMGYFSMIADITVGILFGFAFLALLAAVMATLMLLQLRKAAGPSMIYTVPAFPTFSSQPPKYAELYNADKI